MVAIAESISNFKSRGSPQLRRHRVCSAENPRFCSFSRLIVDRCSLTVDDGQDPAGYPGAAAHPRPGASAGFRGADAEHNCGELRSPPLNPGAAAHCRGVGTGFRGADEERKCIEHRSLPLNPGAAAHCRGVGTGFLGADAEHNCGELRSLPLNPGAAALSRAGRGTGFRGVDAKHNCGELRSPPFNINGANTYQFVMSNPVGSVDPWGTQVYGVHPYISSPLEPLAGPGTNGGEIAAGLWNFGLGLGEAAVGFTDAETGVGFVVGVDGVLRGSNGLREMWNGLGFGGHLSNPLPHSVLAATGLPPWARDLVGAWDDWNPDTAMKAMKEADDLSKLLARDLAAFLAHARNLFPSFTCPGPYEIRKPAPGEIVTLYA